jgi:hypothetical protein
MTELAALILKLIGIRVDLSEKLAKCQIDLLARLQAELAAAKASPPATPKEITAALAAVQVAKAEAEQAKAEAILAEATETEALALLAEQEAEDDLENQEIESLILKIREVVEPVD